MIKDTEIKSIAVKYRVPLSRIERDYAQNWLLKYLNQINLALKGGTGLRKVYFKEYRFSDDLDFTMLEEIGGERTLKSKIEQATSKVKEESGINFFGVTGFEKSDTGYKFKVGFQMSQTMNIQLDVTTYNNEEVILPVVERSINHIFSDNFEGVIKAYDINEILVEKVRSIFQRGLPRDFYDVWYLINNGVEINKELLERKFEYKGLDVDIHKIEPLREKIKSGWINSLSKQIHDVPNFEMVFEKVLNELKKYELWKAI